MCQALIKPDCVDGLIDWSCDNFYVDIAPGGELVVWIPFGRFQHANLLHQISSQIPGSNLHSKSIRVILTNFFYRFEYAALKSG